MSKYLTIVFRLADNAVQKLVFEQMDRISGATLSAAAWSHVMDERDAFEAENKRLREVLDLAAEAMDERRGYAEAWEWKYGKAWDAEDAQVRAALAPEEGR